MISDEALVERYYKALVERDATFLGSFIVGVKTTGVCCIPTCRARKPLRKNCTFYKTFERAIANGFRPCKICNPQQNPASIPDFVKKAVALLEQQTNYRLSDQDLRALGQDPVRLRRYFKAAFGLTFQAYQRERRLGKAVRELQAGASVTQTAYDNGYESLSGFVEAFKRNLTLSPSKSKNPAAMLMLKRIETPLGPMLAGALSNGICMLEFVDRPSLKRELEDLKRLTGATPMYGEHELLDELSTQLKAYFLRKRSNFDLPLVLPGTPFQQSVWRALVDYVPFGTTRSYGWLAKQLNNPKAVRAVAAANGANRCSIIVPCHRIIGANGKLTGYGGGLPRKQRLLALEGQGVLF